MVQVKAAVGLVVISIVSLAGTSQAQSIRDRLWLQTSRWTPPDTRLLLAQVDNPTTPPAPQPAASATPGAKSPDAPLPELPKRRKPIVFSLDGRFGLDSDRFFVEQPVPFEVSVKRRIRSVVLSGTYPVSDRAQVSVNLPYIDQSARLRASTGGSVTQNGQGLGDVSIWVNRTFPDFRRAREYGISAGMVFPTGRDPFNLPVNKLNTGLGFYQPSIRLSARTTKAPLQFFSTFDYSSSLSRSVNGQSQRLPASYGGEIGIFYTMGPVFSTQTSLSLAKSSSPFLRDNGNTVGYLTQALNYNPGTGANFRAGVDVGLTDDSTDVYFGLSVNQPF